MTINIYYFYKPYATNHTPPESDVESEGQTKSVH